MRVRRHILHRASFVICLSLLVVIPISHIRALFIAPWFGLGLGTFAFSQAGFDAEWMELREINESVEERIRYTFGCEDPWIMTYSNVPRGTSFIVLLPILYPMLGCALLAWFTRAKTKPGHCRCGYNLTGNVSGRCPECGAKVSSGVAAHEA